MERTRKRTVTRKLWAAGDKDRAAREAHEESKGDADVATGARERDGFLEFSKSDREPESRRITRCSRCIPVLITEFTMERRGRKRKIQEIAESTVLVNQTISELASELAQSDAILRSDINSLQDEVAGLQKQLEDKTAECTRFEEEAAFLHPQAVIDRIRNKLWHHGDLSILNKVIDPRPRVLRNTEARGERSLFLCEGSSKKIGYKVIPSGSQTSELSPKRENDEATPKSMSSRLSPAVSPRNTDMAAAEEKEEKVVITPSESKIVVVSKISPSTDILMDRALTDCAE